MDAELYVRNVGNDMAIDVSARVDVILRREDGGCVRATGEVDTNGIDVLTIEARDGTKWWFRFPVESAEWGGVRAGTTRVVMFGRVDFSSRLGKKGFSEFEREAQYGAGYSVWKRTAVPDRRG